MVSGDDGSSVEQRQAVRAKGAMNGLAVVAMTLLWCACTKANPRSCVDGVCTNPEFPFCDVNGALGGVEKECISVSCEPGAFAECRENTAVVCNAEGTDYVIEPCVRACTSLGCQVCEPNAIACENGVFSRCDMDGVAPENEDCSFGCSDLEPRCVEIVPSNGLADFVVANAFQSDLNLTGNVTIQADGGAITGAPTVASVMIPSPATGRGIRLFFGKSIRLGNVTIVGDQADSPAVAFFAADELVIEGTVRTSVENGYAAGAFSSAACTGAEAGYSPTPPFVTIGGGGGGHATGGGDGGVIPGAAPDVAAGGDTSGSETLVPLRGGCGCISAPTDRVTGGGALQLVSKKRVRIDGVIDVRGAAGKSYEGDGHALGSGGGAGGGVLIEAASVELTANARILATGGSGASKENDGSQSPDVSPARGATCAFPNCGAGGDGAAPGFAARNGGSVSLAAGGGGGGGGGLGYLRINTRDGVYIRQPGAIEAASVSTGTAVVR